uniref:Galectin n=1 Tax=Meloidogyne floridensis TaxID=298350 RepID=A0A915NX47_9BILA
MQKLQLKETEKIYKHELDQLPFIGSTFCLEGTLPKSSDVEGIEKLEISLMHEIGDTLLKMEFQFSTEHGESWLKISSRLYKQRETNEKKYANPIGLSVVELTVRINVEESYFNIRFNDGKTFIKYNYVAPPWMVNWITVRGNIDNVKFGTDAERCSKYISNQLPPHITKIENLKNGQYISVKGKVTKLDENILINFYYGALGWDEERGRVVLQAKITNQNILLCTKKKKEHHCDNVKNLPQKLKTGQIINMVFLATETKFEIYYDDQEIYQFELPLWAIQYVEVTGPLANIEGRERIAEIRK